MSRPRHAASRARRALPSRAAVAGLVALLVSAAPAQAYWTAVATGSAARADAGTLAAPALSAASVTATSAALSWTPPFTPTAYAVSQSPGSLAGCPAAPGTGSSGCAVTSLVPNTAYTWTLTAYRYAWAAPRTVTATTPKQATTTTLSNVTPTWEYVGNTFSATATVTGNAGYGTPAGAVTFSLFTTADCSGTAAYTTTGLALSGGQVTGSLVPGAGTYHWRAVYTPADSYNLASTSACSEAIMVNHTIKYDYTYIHPTTFDGMGHATNVVERLSIQNPRSGPPPSRRSP